MVKLLNIKTMPQWLKLDLFSNNEIFVYYGINQAFGSGAQIIWKEYEKAYFLWCCEHSGNGKQIEKKSELDIKEFNSLISKIESLEFENMKANKLFGPPCNIKNHRVALRTKNIPLTVFESFGFGDIDRTAKSMKLLAHYEFPEAELYLNHLPRCM